MQEQREVVISGSGPAGAFTAALLASRGHDVLLIDKEVFPRDKVCGDAVSTRAFDLLGEAGIKDELEAAVKEHLFNPISTLHLISPAGHLLNVRDDDPGSRGYSAVVAPRVHFDNLIRKRALALSVESLSARVERPLVQKGCVQGVRVLHKGQWKDIKARITVGADGANSVIAAALRPQKKQMDEHRALALRVYAEGFDVIPDTVEFFLYRQILPGYAWVFPFGDGRANIGLGMRLDCYRKAKRSLKEMLDQFLSLPAIRGRVKGKIKLTDQAAWPLNFGSQKGLQYAFDGALLVGDAAGFTNPLTGGGIYMSLVSGKLAAAIIHRALKIGDHSAGLLMEYQALCCKLILRELRKYYRLQQLLMSSPKLVDLYVKRIRRRPHLADYLSSRLLML